MLKFTKMEGIGNDYIYIDGIHQDVPMNPHFITKISDRHFGIGSDGVIVIQESEICDFKMRMFNLDGSEGKMCGNGIRCFAKFVYDHQLTKKTYLEIETLGGIKKVWLIIDNNKVQYVRVNMGQPILKSKEIPCLFDKEEMINEPVEVDGQVYYLTSLSMGNPHTVIYMNHLDFNIQELGIKFEKHILFPESVNTEFVEVVNRQYLKMRVWERGSGETMACGTGACAVMYASYINGLCDNHVQVELLGGILDISYENGEIWMSGPATTVFEGIIQEEVFNV